MRLSAVGDWDASDADASPVKQALELDGRTLGLIGLAVLFLAVLGVLAGLVISRGRQPEEATPFPLSPEDYVLPDIPGDMSNPPFLPHRGIQDSWTEADIQPFMPDLRAAASEALRQRSLDAVDEALDAVPPLR